ncbi:hypothetical protein MMC25_001319 [Agyrium rufum]|nr:hypothetical protein [Agyrium rufum]
MVIDNDYEKIPFPDRWMAHATTDMSTFFILWKRRFERLVWMPLYNCAGQARTAEWYITAVKRQQEEDLLSSDDEFEIDESDVDRVEGDGESESEGQDDVNYDDDDDEQQISEEELKGLMEDAFGEDAEQKLNKMRSQFADPTASRASAGALLTPTLKEGLLDESFFNRKTRRFPTGGL